MMVSLFFALIFVYCSSEETFIDYINVGYNVRLDSSLGNPIFLYTFDEKKTFQWPENPSLGTFKVPDQLYVFNRIGHSENSVKSVYYSFSAFLSEYVESTYFGLDINLPQFGIGVNYAHEVGHMREKMKGNETSSAVCEIEYNLVKLQFIPPNLMKFDDMFDQFVKMMPTSMDTEKDVQILTEFIVKYGTHYYSCGMFGGRIHIDSTMKKSFVMNETVDWVMQQLDLDFRYKLFELAPGFFVNKSSIHINSKFLKNVISHAYFVGGNVEYQDLKDLDKWMKSVILSPQMVSEIHLHPITELFDDAKQKACLKTAISNYIKTGKVKPSE